MWQPKFYECSVCDHYHPVFWNGDCRDGSSRFTADELDDEYGFIGWTEIAEHDVDYYQSTYPEEMGTWA